MSNEKDSLVLVDKRTLSLISTISFLTTTLERRDANIRKLTAELEDMTEEKAEVEEGMSELALDLNDTRRNHEKLWNMLQRAKVQAAKYSSSMPSSRVEQELVVTFMNLITEFERHQNGTKRAEADLRQCQSENEDLRGQLKEDGV